MRNIVIFSVEIPYTQFLSTYVEQLYRAPSAGQITTEVLKLSAPLVSGHCVISECVPRKGNLTKIFA